MYYISTKYKHRVVYNHIKDTKFHQFTTTPSPYPKGNKLSIITSKIQNFINSQLEEHGFIIGIRCL